jgi:hypothetical protein
VDLDPSLLVTDHLLAALADAQHGVAARRQLLALGVSADAVGRLASARRIIPVYRGVYAVGHTVLGVDGRRMAATLATRAPLSHRSAAALWGMRPWSSPFHELTRPGPGGRRDRRRAGLLVHRARSLTPDQVTTERGIPVTTVARTLVDLAGVVPAPGLRRAVERADQLELFDLAAVEHAVARHPGRAGIAALRTLLADFAQLGVTLTRSELEARMLQLCIDRGLSRPAVNFSSDGRELDFRWPAAGLVAETDGWATHKTRAAFEADRARDRRLAVEGWRVVRITHRQLRDEPDAIADDLARLLDRAA